MAKNLIPEICKMLGVELGEEFEIKGYKGLVYKFADDELIVNSTDDRGISGLTANMTLVNLLKGEREIVKLPWKPKKGDAYYTFVRTGIDCTCTLISYKWDGCVIDIALLKAGWVFRTRQEAVAALPAVAKEMGVEYTLNHRSVKEVQK